MTYCRRSRLIKSKDSHFRRGIIGLCLLLLPLTLFVLSSHPAMAQSCSTTAYTATIADSAYVKARATRGYYESAGADTVVQFRKVATRLTAPQKFSLLKDLLIFRHRQDDSARAACSLFVFMDSVVSNYGCPSRPGDTLAAWEDSVKNFIKANQRFTLKKRLILNPSRDSVFWASFGWKATEPAERILIYKDTLLNYSCQNQAQIERSNPFWWQLGAWVPVNLLDSYFGKPQGDFLVRAEFETPPPGDFGDAPDSTLGLAEAGHFPTFYFTSVTDTSRRGPFHCDVTKLWLGGPSDITTTEQDRSNTPDQDRDSSRVTFYKSGDTLGFFVVPITISSSAGDSLHHLNIAADWNGSHDWQKSILGEEWVTKNKIIGASPGNTVNEVVGPFPISSLYLANKPWWMRFTLTKDSIPAADFGANGWDGSGPVAGFTSGETEDLHIDSLKDADSAALVSLSPWDPVKRLYEGEPSRNVVRITLRNKGGLPLRNGRLCYVDLECSPTGPLSSFCIDIDSVTAFGSVTYQFAGSFPTPPDDRNCIGTWQLTYQSINGNDTLILFSEAEQRFVEESKPVITAPVAETTFSCLATFTVTATDPNNDPVFLAFDSLRNNGRSPESPPSFQGGGYNPIDFTWRPADDDTASTPWLAFFHASDTTSLTRYDTVQLVVQIDQCRPVITAPDADTASTCSATFTVLATDPTGDLDTLVFDSLRNFALTPDTSVHRPAISGDNDSIFFEWKPTASEISSEPWLAFFTARDTFGLTRRDTVQIFVQTVQHNPIISFDSPDSLGTFPCAGVSFKATATDPCVDVEWLRLVSLTRNGQLPINPPDTIRENAATIKFSWLPHQGDASADTSWLAIFTASDSAGLLSNDTVKITVSGVVLIDSVTFKLVYPSNATILPARSQFFVEVEAFNKDSLELLGIALSFDTCRVRVNEVNRIGRLAPIDVLPQATSDISNDSGWIKLLYSKGLQRSLPSGCGPILRLNLTSKCASPILLDSARFPGYYLVYDPVSGPAFTPGFSPFEFPVQIPKGDLNCDGVVEQVDIITLINKVFLGEDVCSDEAADVNCDGNIDIVDAVTMVNKVFFGVPFPC